MMSLQVHLGLDEAGIEAQLLDLLATSALPRELPVVVIDRSGPIGTALYSRLLLLAQGKRPRDPFQLDSYGRPQRLPDDREGVGRWCARLENRRHHIECIGQLPLECEAMTARVRGLESPRQ
jgi:hypothetical protein